MAGHHEENGPGCRRAELPGGRLLVVRPVRTSDVDGVEALYAGLDDDARYRRFFAVYRPAREWFERLAAVADRGGLGLVATVSEPTDGTTAAGPTIVGEASLEPLPNGDGELAITVDRAWRGWLGPYLLDALVEAADAAGIPNVEADVLCSNLPMLSLIRCREYAVMPKDEWTVMRLMIATGGAPTPRWPDGEDGPRVLVEGAGGRWRGAAAAEAAGLHVLGCPGPEGRRRACPALGGQPCPLAAAADAIVVNHPPDTEQWHRLRAVHAELHPGVPVLVELAPQDEPRQGETRLAGDPEDEVAAVGRAAAERRIRRERPSG
jgi:hypothetical protein